MTIALSQQKSVIDGTNATTATLTFDSAPATGSLITIISTVNTLNTVSTVSGGGVTTWIKEKEAVGSTNNCCASIWSGIVDTTISAVVTVTYSAKLNGNKCLYGAVWTGAKTTSRIDGTPGSSQGTSSTPNSGSTTTSSATDLVIAAFAASNSFTKTSGPTNSFVDLTKPGSGARGIASYKIETGTETATTTWTLTGSNDWVGAIVAFLPEATNPVGYVYVAGRAVNRGAFY